MVRQVVPRSFKDDQVARPRVPMSGSNPHDGAEKSPDWNYRKSLGDGKCRECSLKSSPKAW